MIMCFQIRNRHVWVPKFNCYLFINLFVLPVGCTMITWEFWMYCSPEGISDDYLLGALFVGNRTRKMPLNCVVVLVEVDGVYHLWLLPICCALGCLQEYDDMEWWSHLWFIIVSKNQMLRRNAAYCHPRAISILTRICRNSPHGVTVLYFMLAQSLC
jgi:hypothetical protein